MPMTNWCSQVDESQQKVIVEECVSSIGFIPKVSFSEDNRGRKKEFSFLTEGVFEGVSGLGWGRARSRDQLVILLYTNRFGVFNNVSSNCFICVWLPQDKG